LSSVVHAPRQLIEKHKDIIIISVMLFIIGFVVGFHPEYGKPIIENAQKIPINRYAMSSNFKSIFVNNGVIAIVLCFGWFIFPFHPDCIPFAVMVYNVGAAFGAVAAYTYISQFLASIISFGLIEALGYVFAMSAGLLFPKYVVLKLLNREATLSSYVTDSLAFMLYSFVSLALAALLEALLLYPIFYLSSIALGIISTFLYLRYFIFRR